MKIPSNEFPPSNHPLISLFLNDPLDNKTPLYKASFFTLQLLLGGAKKKKNLAQLAQVCVEDKEDLY